MPLMSVFREYEGEWSPQNRFMTLDEDACYRALQARDRRFDGLFFVGVSSTGIYCRCVCPAKTPLAKNCTYFSNAATAEKAGFRPCLRCRPEIAPGRSVGPSKARQAAYHIENGGLDDGGIEELAATLHVSARQLRRSMKEELGVTPIDLAQTRRLLEAKRLLTDTGLPIGEVAMASGFTSLRRFNELFGSRYGIAPSAFRRKGMRVSEDRIRCELGYRSPFDWEALMGFLRPRLIVGVESVVDMAYRRALTLRGHSGVIQVVHNPGRHSVSVEISAGLAPVLPLVLARVRRLLDLDAEPETISSSLGDLAARNPGLRLPGVFDGFEASVRAILGQQITVRFATTLAGKFAEAFGPEAPTNDFGLTRIFPTPDRVALETQDSVAGLGVIGSRARSILALSHAVAERRIRLTPGAAYEETLETLLSLPGIGPWTAEYICMRALGHPDAFPASDLGVLKALGTRYPKHALELAEAWRPWRSYAVMHLWKQLEERE
jgi:AraC family transcriptional regulator of adaptative response / DNA-3-methyladenine glycosylase II